MVDRLSLLRIHYISFRGRRMHTMPPLESTWRAYDIYQQLQGDDQLNSFNIGAKFLPAARFRDGSRRRHKRHNRPKGRLRNS